MVIVDGVQGKPYVLVSAPVFDVDGHLFAYGAQRGARTFLVINGTEFDQYANTTRVGGTPRFFKDRVLRFHVLRGEEVVRVDAESLRTSDLHLRAFLRSRRVLRSAAE